MSLHNPFIDTILYTTVELSPDQLNNNIYSNLKQNLINALERKCFRNYGYISKIYEILERDNGFISAEDRDCNVTYRVKFGCRLCHPLEGTQIVCQVNKTRDIFVNLTREPINIFVTADRINRNAFAFDPTTGKLKVIKTGEVVEDKTFVKATIMAKNFADRETRIMAMATLDDIATDEEIEEYYGTIHSTEKKFVSLDDYKASAANMDTTDDNQVYVMEKDIDKEVEKKEEPVEKKKTSKKVKKVVEPIKDETTLDMTSSDSDLSELESSEEIV